MIVYYNYISQGCCRKGNFDTTTSGDNFGPSRGVIPDRTRLLGEGGGCCVTATHSFVKKKTVGSTGDYARFGLAVVSYPLHRYVCDGGKLSSSP